MTRTINITNGHAPITEVINANNYNTGKYEVNGEYLKNSEYNHKTFAGKMWKLPVIDYTDENNWDKSGCTPSLIGEELTFSFSAGFKYPTFLPLLFDANWDCTIRLKIKGHKVGVQMDFISGSDNTYVDSSRYPVLTDYEYHLIELNYHRKTIRIDGVLQSPGLLDYSENGLFRIGLYSQGSIGESNYVAIKQFEVDMYDSQDIFTSNNWQYILDSNKTVFEATLPSISDETIDVGRYYFNILNNFSVPLMEMGTIKVKCTTTNITNFEIGLLTLNGNSMLEKKCIDNSEYTFNSNGEHTIEFRIWDIYAYVYIDGTYTNKKLNLNNYILNEETALFYCYSAGGLSLESVQYSDTIHFLPNEEVGE